jgi:hypothetical protein
VGLIYEKGLNTIQNIIILNVFSGDKNITSKRLEGVEWIKAKYSHSRDTLKNPLNIDSDTNNEEQDCKIGAVWGALLMWEG